MDLDRVKVTPRDQQVLDLLVLSCSNKAAATRLQQQGNRWSIEYQSTDREAALAHPFLRAGIRDGRKRVRLATAAFEKAELKS
jgi:hypothetical protein